MGMCNGKGIRNLLQNVRKDEHESEQLLHMTANENVMSKTASSFLNSNLSYRYHFDRTYHRDDKDPGTFLGSFLYKGLPGVYALEKEATEAVKEMVGAVGVDFRPLSGVHAMMETVISATKVNDLVYTIPREAGGHFTTASLLEFIGRRPRLFPVDKTEYVIDTNVFGEEVENESPALIYFDTSYHLFPYELTKIREIVGDNTILVYDASHTLGLIAGGQFQDPLREGCDVLQGNTHKTFPGPQKAMIAFGNSCAEKRIEDGINVGLVSSQHTHHAICLYITVLEMKQFGKEYARQIVANAQELGRQISSQGFCVYGEDKGFTKSHTIIVTDREIDVNMYEMCKRLFKSGISTNTSSVFGVNGIRVGLQEVTRLGMKEKEMADIAEFYYEAIINQDFDTLERKVLKFRREFTDVHFSFDSEHIID